jgi:NTP pyrophosphatase (non-canonical NTP hydrolase)
MRRVVSEVSVVSDEKILKEVFNNTFCHNFNTISEMVHTNAVKKGFWENPKNDGEMIALMHSELSEALEGLRHGDPPSDHIQSFSSVEEELADVIIRIMDYSVGKNLNISKAILEKIEFNNGREYMHGGKKF